MTLSPATIWWIIAGMAVGTFLLRFSFVLLAGKVEMPEPVQRMLRFVPAAVLSALVFPAMIVRDDAVALHAGNERLLAGAVAALVAIRTRSVVPTIAVGMIALWILEAL